MKIFKELEVGDIYIIKGDNSAQLFIKINEDTQKAKHINCIMFPQMNLNSMGDLVCVEKIGKVNPNAGKETY